MTSLLLAIYCVYPGDFKQNTYRPSFLREAGGVQAPLHTTQILSFVVQYRLIAGIRSSHFLEGRAKPRPSEIYHLMRKLNCISRGESQ